jgi:hypothetical protein
MLSPAERALVRGIVQAALPGARISVFGSRDLDLLLHEPATLTLAQRAAPRDPFKASELPFQVDLVALDELATGYRERVLGEAVGL